MTHPPSAGSGAATPVVSSAPNVHNGTYTVAHTEKGHYTLKLYTAQEGDLAGKRILAMLIGPNNTADFRGVAFWDDAALRVNVWKRFRSLIRTQPIDGYTFGEKWNLTEQKLATWADLVIRGTTEEQHGYWYTEGYRLLLEARCVCCNRPLTDPISISLGRGPTCRGDR